jgi:hypothetical protein
MLIGSFPNADVFRKLIEAESWSGVNTQTEGKVQAKEFQIPDKIPANCVRRPNLAVHRSALMSCKLAQKYAFCDVILGLRKRCRKLYGDLSAEDRMYLARSKNSCSCS